MAGRLTDFFAGFFGVFFADFLAVFFAAFFIDFFTDFVADFFTDFFTDFFADFFTDFFADFFGFFAAFAGAFFPPLLLTVLPREGPLRSVPARRIPDVAAPAAESGVAVMPRSASFIHPLSPYPGAGLIGIGTGSLVIGVSSIHPALAQPDSLSSRWDIGSPRQLRGTARRWSRGAHGAAGIPDPLP